MSRTPDNVNQAQEIWERRSISATLEEDAHPGSGAGGAGVDALVARDCQGRPVIWASHIEGLLRDAARKLHGESKAKQLFGARGGKRQSALFTSLYSELNPESRFWRSAARESYENRAPKDDTLRAIEFVPRKTTFEGQAEIPASQLDLFERLFKEIDAVGAGRATGAGRVEFALGKVPVVPRSLGTTTSRMILLLRNLDPLCLAATAVPGNLIPTFAFVPGRSLLGSLADWLFTAGDVEAASYLTGGQLSVGDALPVANIDPSTPLESIEVLPAPVSLQMKKPAGLQGDLPWWARQSAPLKRVDARISKEEEASSLKRPEPNLFVARTGNGRWFAYKPEVRVRLRNGRPDPDQADPSLFAIEQIAERTCFLAEIEGNPAALGKVAAALSPALQGLRWLRMGRSGTPVEVVRVEWAGDRTKVPPLEEAYLTLTSDLLIRDRYLRWVTQLNRSDFSLIKDWPEDVSVDDASYQDETPVNGFNGTSRLWRAPAMGIRRGSVFRISGRTGIARLMQRATSGVWLGERIHEGFGRFRIDVDLPGLNAADEPARPEALCTATFKDAQTDTTAAITRRWLTERKALAGPPNSSSPVPSLSQWQDLLAELLRKGIGAIASRKHPTTVGGRSWTHPDAQAILDKIAALAPSDQAEHARWFVRWLRSGLRRERA